MWFTHPLGIGFLMNSTTVGESDGVATFTLISSFPFDEPFTVQVTSDPLSARSMLDTLSHLFVL